MCTLTLQTEPSIAKGAITVYKLFLRNPWVYEKKLISPYKRYEWKLNVEEYAELARSNKDQTPFDGEDLKFLFALKIKNNDDTTIKAIASGLHGATRLKRLERRNRITKVIFVKGYIPKGAEYYTTGDGLIVANRMIMKKILTTEM